MIDFADVSVVIPCYCCVNTIERAVDSVLKQTILPREIILVDDASPDNTLDLLKAIEGGVTSVSIVVKRLDTNGGAGSARNLGWISAKSRYIAFLDSDDSWHPEKLRIQYELMLANPQIKISAHEIKILTDKDTNTRRGDIEMEGGLDVGEFVNINFHEMLFFNKFPTPTVMLQADLLGEMSFRYRYSEDYDLWLRILSKYKTALYIKFPLSYVYKGTFGVSGLSSRLLHMELGELRNFHNLRRAGDIGWVLFFLASFFSVAKFLRRVSYSFAYKVRRIF